MKHQHQHGYWTRHEHVNTYNIQNIEHSTGVVSVSDTDTDACRAPDTARDWSVHARIWLKIKSTHVEIRFQPLHRIRKLRIVYIRGKSKGDKRRGWKKKESLKSTCFFTCSVTSVPLKKYVPTMLNNVIAVDSLQMWNFVLSPYISWTLKTSLFLNMLVKIKTLSFEVQRNICRNYLSFWYYIVYF